MKKKSFFLVLWTCFVIAANAQQPKTVSISNPSPILRSNEVIEIPWNQLMKAYPNLDTADFKVVNAATKKEYPYQLETKGTEKIQNLLVQVSIPAKSSINLQLVKGQHMSFTLKTYCRYVPERKDDFAWENDRIAFRMYGKALENTPKEMAYGVDVWVKRTDKLIINQRYKRGEYHVDHGDGMDYYHVGYTLGAGGIAPYINDSIWHSKNYREWKILDNGPLRSTFQLKYDEWAVAGRKVTVTKTISINAGSQLNKVEAYYNWSDNKPLPVVVGIVKRTEPGELLLAEKQGVLAYWEPQHGIDGTTGVGCILTTPVSQMIIKEKQSLAETQLLQPGTLVYYQGAAWDKAGLITSAEQWFKYLHQQAELLKNPLNVVVQEKFSKSSTHNLKNQLNSNSIK